MMDGIQCREIFNAVYANVKNVYLSNLFSVKKKSKVVSENITEDENLQKVKTYTPDGETNVNTKDVSGSNTETVEESIERLEENKVASKIRMDIEEKFPFVMASVCSNLSRIDKEYRKMKDYDEQPEFSEYMLDISQIFPLSDRFVLPAIMFVSSMVLIDIDEDKSDDFYERYASSVSQIISELPFDSIQTVEKYPY